MKLKRIVISALLTMGVVALAAGCSPKESKSSSTSSSAQNSKTTKVTIATMAAPDSAPLYVAADKGYFKKDGLDVKLSLFKDPNKRDAATSAGQADAAVVDFTSFTSYMRSKKPDWKLITQLTGRFGVAIPKNSNVKSVKDLKGKKVANMSRQVTSYYMYKTLKQNDVNPKDVDQVNVPQIPQRLEMIKNNQAAAAVLPQTFLTMAKVQGCKILTQSGSDFQVTALAAKGKLLSDKDVRSKFLKAYNRAVNELNDHPDVLTQVMEKDLSLPAPVAKAAPKQFPRYNKAKTPSVKTMKQVLKFAKEEGFFTKKVNPADYIVPVD
ncbi:ABC transporter substrate-binding protein [Lactobacillus hominis]|uniref:ABC transporter substrate-binding protein n=1 Tax=Lactobacillus hominis TaxID=1203033 RepID=UPI0026EB91B4|nr:MetQ/NlpA family ABC transporter substrate-binding protein [Lactobacillus hominis]